MPTYIYKCPECGETVEMLHKMNTTKTPVCRICDSVMEKQVTATKSIEFHGVGFYCNDYADDSQT